MSCCNNCSAAAEGTNKFFSRWSKSYARKFRRRGLEKAQKYLLEGVRKEPVTSKQILDIGCGVGSLHLTLLKEGAAKAVGVELSEGMIDQANKFAGRLGVQDKVDYVLGDFVEHADSIRQADISLLDKVVCCYENVDLLVEKSTSKTKSIYALSHPKENVFIRAMFETHIAIAKLFRWKFRPFWHDWTRVRQLIQAQGFQLIYENSTIVWQVLVFKREARLA